MRSRHPHTAAEPRVVISLRAALRCVATENEPRGTECRTASRVCRMGGAAEGSKAPLLGGGKDGKGYGASARRARPDGRAHKALAAGAAPRAANDGGIRLDDPARAARGLAGMADARPPNANAGGTDTLSGVTDERYYLGIERATIFNTVEDGLTEAEAQERLVRMGLYFFSAAPDCSVGCR